MPRLPRRAFSRDPQVVSEGGPRQRYAAGARGGIAATAKHFPGLGGAQENTDHAPVTIRPSRAELDAVDLQPFGAAIAAGVPLVMACHARYPALDRDCVASQSPPILAGVLREELGFRGVLVTDRLEAGAALATGSVTKVAERASGPARTCCS